MPERAVDPVHCLADFLQHQHVAGQVGLQRRADEVAEDGDVEGGGGRLANARLQGRGVALHQELKRPRYCGGAVRRGMSEGIGPWAIRAKPAP